MAKKIILLWVVLLLITCAISNVSSMTLLNEIQQSNKTNTEKDPLNPLIVWEETFGTPMNNDGGSYVLEISDGYILTGHKQGEDDYDIWVIKTNFYGEVLWDDTYGLEEYKEISNEIKQTSDGGYIIIGSRLSYGEEGNFDILLIKISEDGYKEWEKTYDSGVDERGYSVIQTEDNGYLILGDNYEWFGYQDWTQKIWLIKVDEYGYEEWDKIFENNNMDEPNCMQKTRDNGYIILGKTTHSNWDSFIWLIKIDEHGIIEWEETYFNELVSWGNAIQQTHDNGFIICGKRWGSLPSADSDLWLFKIDEHGNEEWQVSYGSMKDDEGSFVQQTSDGGYIVTGYTNGISDEINYEFDIWLVKTNKYGEKIWDRNHGRNTIISSGNCIQQTSDGGFIVTGHKGLDVWLAKTDEDGKITRSRQNFLTKIIENKVFMFLQKFIKI